VRDKESVLIVDDQVLITYALSRYLSAMGYEVTTVNSPVKALLMMDDERFDVVVSDLKMSPISGVEIVRHLRRSGFDGKIIMMSASFGKCGKKLQDFKVDALLEKPFEMSSLLEVIRA
jgi:two-component system, response regulator FlrC